MMILFTPVVLYKMCKVNHIHIYPYVGKTEQVGRSKGWVGVNKNGGRQTQLPV